MTSPNSRQARACKHPLIPQEETALLLATNYD
jgi:hypothetical protein